VHTSYHYTITSNSRRALTKFRYLLCYYTKLLQNFIQVLWFFLTLRVLLISSNKNLNLNETRFNKETLFKLHKG
jgi:hypothetical protein